MITTENIPDSYRPYPRLMICSNTIIGGGHLILIGNVLPLLIGMGPKPMIWLQAVADPRTNNFITVVDSSIATHPAFRVTEQENEIVVSISGQTILSVQSPSSDIAIVNELDLRPIGINVHGDRSSLFAGSMQFSTSTFSGVNAVIAFGS